MIIRLGKDAPQKPQKKRRKREYSKLILGAVMILFFAGALFGGAMVYIQGAGLEALLTYIGAPTATAIGFYSWKAKNENVRKYGSDIKDFDSEE